MPDCIQPLPRNPSYWQYRGGPVVLLGAPGPADLPQYPDLLKHLEAVEALGCNFVRCCFDPCAEVGPFQRASGKADLAKPNAEYWRRFELFLSLTHSRGIIVQLEFWDNNAFSAERWSSNIWNPANNRNYSSKDSGLPKTFDEPAVETFFRSVPTLDDNAVLLEQQARFFSLILDHSLKFGHILYCISSETRADPKWTAYWCDVLRSRSASAGCPVQVSESWAGWDVSEGAVVEAIKNPSGEGVAGQRESISRPIRYGYLEASAVNAQSGPVHYQSLLWLRRSLRDTSRSRPIVASRVYGAGANGTPGNLREGLARFWRCIFAGLSAVRLELPPEIDIQSGEVAAHLRGALGLTRMLDMFVSEPRPDLIEPQDGSQAYCFGNPANAMAILIINGGSVGLDCEPMDCRVTQSEMDFKTGAWSTPVPRAGASIRIGTDQPFYLALFKAEE